ncbi:MAG: ISAzo13 family transposase [Thermoplasmataceae archaeon]
MEKKGQYDYLVKALKGADEVQARRFAAAMALGIGWGGISRIVELTGMSHSTIEKGIREIQDQERIEKPEKLRADGGGRKKVELKDQNIITDLEIIMDENTAGDPMSFLRWSSKSTRKISDELKSLGHNVGPNTVARLLKEKDYSLQVNVKSFEGLSVEERDAQFRHINEEVKSFARDGDPVISVDTKKKELVGDFKNAGRTWVKSKEPRKVNAYDFRSMAIGMAIPYGIYDVTENDGMVNIGNDHDTSEFAVESVRQWWSLIGRHRYPDAKRLLICADGGGSNGSRNRGWKIHLQELVNQIRIPITVCHYPPGTSKWNRIEHRMFSFISMNWKGKPLVNYETVVKLIGSTETRNGLKVAVREDKNKYPTGVKFSDEDLAKIHLKPDSLHPKWNYEILPDGNIPRA